MTKLKHFVIAFNFFHFYFFFLSHLLHCLHVAILQKNKCWWCCQNKQYKHFTASDIYPYTLDDLSWTVFYERVIAGNFSRINHFVKMHAIIEWCVRSSMHKHIADRHTQSIPHRKIKSTLSSSQEINREERTREKNPEEKHKPMLHKHK